MNTPFKTYSSQYASADQLLHPSKLSKWDTGPLQRVCDGCFIPKSIEQRAIDLLHTEEFINKRNGREKKDLSLICYALYHCCLNENIGKPAKLLCSWLNIEEKDFWQTQSSFGYSRRKISPSELLSLITCDLDNMGSGLSYADLKKIGDCADKFAENSCCSPNVILAAHVFLYLKNIRKMKITVRSIAKMCDISCTSLTALKRELENQNA